MTQSIPALDQLLAFIRSTAAPDWQQMGADIDGEAADDASGWSVSLSSDGTIVAIGAYGNDGTGNAAGHVRVYEYSGSAWVQKGGDIDGEAASDVSGWSVSLSSSGNIVAIGAYGNDGTGSQAGHVRVYEYSGSAWVQKGGDIDGEAAYDLSGYSVSLSSDGSIVAIGANLNDGTGTSAGHVRVYEYDATKTTTVTDQTSSDFGPSGWRRLGGDIDGEAAGDQSGYSASLSSDGTIVAIGAGYNDGAAGGGSIAGHVRVYEYDATKTTTVTDQASSDFGPSGWRRLGGDIDGEAAGDQSGYSASLSSDGTIVAIGANLNDGTGTSAGHVRVYEYDATKTTTVTDQASSDFGPSGWRRLGGDIDGEAAGDQSGRSVSLSSDGTIVAIGAYGNDGTSSQAGHVRVYEYDSAKTTTVTDQTSSDYGPSGWRRLGADIDGEAFGDLSGFSVSLSSDGSIVAIGAYDNDGAGNTAGHVRVYQIAGGTTTTAGGTTTTAGGTTTTAGGTTTTAGGTTTTAGGTTTTAGGTTTTAGSTTTTAGSTTTTAAPYWQQMGGDIDGEAIYDESGYSVSLSSDGTIVAIGAPYNDATGTDAGHVRVYEYSGSAWVQKGGDIDGEAASDVSGWSVSLSSDGSIVAIGAYGNDGTGNAAGHVRVYEYSGSAWVQKGGDIDGEAASDVSGWSVSLSSSGNIVAIGAYGNDGTGSQAGHVRVYEYSGSAWVQKGGDIDGEAAYDLSGYSVSLSSDGSIVAIGAYLNDGTGTDAGHVRVYEYSGSAWVQKGGDIDGEATGDYSGRSVSLSSDGSIVAIGAYSNDGTGINAGHVRVYEYSGSAWVQKGGDIDGEAASDLSGYSVSLSSDGTIVAIGAIDNDGAGNAAGHVRVYEYSGSAWVQKGGDIDGEATGDQSGYSVSLSSDGSIVAIGAIYNDGTDSNAGHVRVYQI
jgi:hypothetical protein